MAAQMFPVATGLAGQLWIMPCPDGLCLSSEIDAYCAAGVDILVSMLAEEEAHSLSLAAEREFCEAVGIRFENVPIADFGLPEPEVFGSLIDRITQWLQTGRNVGVHCRAGIGRSGMVTAGVLIATGQQPDAAVKQVSTARGQGIPDTVEQFAFLETFAGSLTSNVRSIC